MKRFDLVVVGSGPGGYVAAVRGAHAGLKVAVIERDSRLGGTCLLRGCIPTKSLLHAADVLDEVRHAGAAGIVVGEPKIDFARVQRARGQAVDKGAAGVDYLMKSNKITVLRGTGSLVDPRHVRVTGPGTDETVEAGAIVVATGSGPRRLASLPHDGKHIVTSDEILALEHIPKSLLVLGGGAVGVEFASVFSRFGSRVVVVEMQETLVPNEDRDIGIEFARIFKRRGLESHVGTRLEGATVKGKEVVVELSAGGKAWTERVEMLLVAVGRAPVTAGLEPQAAGLKLDAGGYVEVDSMMRTSVPGIFAIGDVVRTPWLAHVASAEGILVADQVAGKAPEPLNYAHTPSCTYSSPEVGSVGLSEAAARARGLKVKVGKFPFSAVPKARVMGATEGLVKIVAEETYDELLGVHIVGPRATDLIAEACVALRLEATAESLAHTIHAHPTLSEGILEAAHATIGRPLHL